MSSPARGEGQSSFVSDILPDIDDPPNASPQAVALDFDSFDGLLHLDDEPPLATSDDIPVIDSLDDFIEFASLD